MYQGELIITYIKTRLKQFSLLRIKYLVKKLIFFNEIKNILNFFKDIEKSKKFNFDIIRLSENREINKNNNLCIFSHFDTDNIIDEYVINYLKSINDSKFDIIFVSTSEKLNNDEINKINFLCKKIIVKKNNGYDFGSWVVGLNSINNDILLYDNLIICNDSVYAPLFNLPNIISKMNKRNCDFWGITDSYQHSYHLQSYFIFFKKTVFSSSVFYNFWNNYRVYTKKRNIIRNYEINLTKYFISNGFKSEVLCPTIDFFDYRKVNTTHNNWKILITKYRCPIIKIELLKKNPLNINIDDVETIIKNESSYNFNLIKDHLNRFKNKN